MKRIRSGVLAPEFEEKPGVVGVGGANEVVGEANVVERCKFVVSDDGGGGRDLSSGCKDNMDAFQRKHSPVP